jgi:hypothetical protein
MQSLIGPRWALLLADGRARSSLEPHTAETAARSTPLEKARPADRQALREQADGVVVAIGSDDDAQGPSASARPITRSRGLHGASDKCRSSRCGSYLRPASSRCCGTESLLHCYATAAGPTAELRSTRYCSSHCGRFSSLQLDAKRFTVDGKCLARRPEIALAMTNCWISEVPSKIVWFKLSEYAASVSCCAVPLSRPHATRRRLSSCCRIRLVLGRKLGMTSIFGRFGRATSLASRSSVRTTCSRRPTPQTTEIFRSSSMPTSWDHGICDQRAAVRGGVALSNAPPPTADTITSTSSSSTGADDAASVVCSEARAAWRPP